MMQTYIKDKAGKFQGSIPHVNTVPITLPSIPEKPSPEEKTINYPLDDISRWDLSTAHDLGVSSPDKPFVTERGRKLAMYMSGSTFVGIQAGYVGTVAAMPSWGMPPAAAAAIAALTLPIVIALASLPGKEFMRAKRATISP